MEQSIDTLVLEVLQTKLSVILSELGADKTGDVLNSVDRHVDAVYLAAIAGDDLSVAGDAFEAETRTETIEEASFLRQHGALRS